MVERGVRTLKETLLTNIKAGEKFGKALDIALEIMRKTPHTRIKKSAFELHYGREPNTEMSNMLNLDALKTITKSCISAKPDTLQVYSFSGAGGASDTLPMKQKKGAKGVSKYPFLFLEKKINKPKFESAHSDKTQIAISGTKHTVTTSDNKISHRKHISKPISEIVQENSTNRGTGPRGPDSRFTKSQRIVNVQDSDSDHGEASPVAIATATTTFGEHTTQSPKNSTIGRGRPKLIRNRQNSGSPGETHTSPDQQSSIGPLTVVTENMTDAEIDPVIEDARRANIELHLKDNNGKVIQNNYQSPKGGEEDNVENSYNEQDTSELELLSNLSSSTEIEQETKEHNLRRSKRLTKTNPIIRLNNPVPSDYRKYRQTTEWPGKHTGYRGQYGQQLIQQIKWTTPEEHSDNRTIKEGSTRNTVNNDNSSGRKTASTVEYTLPIG